jgi:hypothetical protein
MGHSRFLTSISAILLLALATTAGAATISEVSGTVTLNGQPVTGETPFPEGGRLVVGEGATATVVTGSGDRIVLQSGATLLLNVVEEDKEIYELLAGAFIGTMSSRTVVMLPNAGRLEIPADAEGNPGTAELAVESRENGTRTAIEVNEGTAQLRSGRQFRTVVGAGQSVTVTFMEAEPRKIEFATGPDNEGDVLVYDQATDDLEIEVGVPAATKGKMTAVEANTKTKIENSLDSSKDGKLAVVSRVKGEETARGDVAPGVFAYVLHETGAIEFEYVEIDFQVLKRAIGLTSEFTTLAVSNFTGVLSPQPGGVKTKRPPPPIEQPKETD